MNHTNLTNANHNDCAKSTIQKDYLITNAFTSNFSQFFENQKYIFKVRKKDSRLFLDSKTKSKEIDLTIKEYNRGKLFENNLYIELIDIPCMSNGASCNLALKMIKLPDEKRIDSLISKGLFAKSDIEIISNKLTSIYKKVPLAAKHYNYCQGLKDGNERIIESVTKHQAKKDYDIIYNSWNYIDKKTQVLNNLFINRKSENKVKLLHGDLSFQNTFINDNEYFMIDPCVAFYDMYAIDILYQFADVIVELSQDKLNSFIELLIEEYKNKIAKNISQELLDYYIFTHSLIRATVNWIFDKPIYQAYLKIAKKYALQNK